MKRLYIVLFLIIGAVGYGQVGSGATLPLGSFHVDAKKDNSPENSPTSQQVANDVIVDEKGQVGLGRLKPEVKLDAKGGLQVQDGILKIGTTPMLDDTNLKLLVIDKQGSVGTKVIAAPKVKPLATLRSTGTSNVNEGSSFLTKYNDAVFVSVPFKSTDFVLNEGNIIAIANTGDIEVKQDGYYQLSAMLNIVLSGSGSAGQGGDSYFKAQLLRSTDKGASWTLITGIRNIFLVYGGKIISYPHIFPASIAQLNNGDLIRIQYARSANDGKPQGFPVKHAYLGYSSELGLYPYQFFISKL